MTDECTDEDPDPDQRRDGTLDPLDDLLADPRCRAVLAYLESVVGWVTFERLVAEVAVRERERADDMADGLWRDVEVSLAHDILPALADAGVVVYEPEAARVRVAGGGDVRSELRRELAAESPDRD